MAMLLTKTTSLLSKKYLFNSIKTNLIRNKSVFYAIKLTNKRLIRVSGDNSFIYLQSLMSNDLRHLLNGEEVPQRTSVYTYMLSALGKVLCDLFVYKTNQLTNHELILEVDSYLANALKRLLIGYNLSRNIVVEHVNDINLWTLIPNSYDSDFINNNDFILKEIISDDLQLVNDPRIPQMGYRLLTRIGGNSFNDIKKFINNDNIVEGKLGYYQKYRYKLGVNEGYSDLLSAYYYPFECNADYLNAVSIDKGLYTSEEKTTKVFIKAPIIKRIFPVEFMCTKSELNGSSPPPQTTICSYNGKEIGFLRNRNQFNGIASLALRNFPNKNGIDFNNLYHKQTGLRLRAWKPEWWPRYTNRIYLPQVDYPMHLFNVIPE